MNHPSEQRQTLCLGRWLSNNKASKKQAADETSVGSSRSKSSSASKVEKRKTKKKKETTLDIIRQDLHGSMSSMLSDTCSVGSASHANSVRSSTRKSARISSPPSRLASLHSSKDLYTSTTSIGLKDLDNNDDEDIEIFSVRPRECSLSQIPQHIAFGQDSLNRNVSHSSFNSSFNNPYARSENEEMRMVNLALEKSVSIGDLCLDDDDISFRDDVDDASESFATLEQERELLEYAMEQSLNESSSTCGKSASASTATRRGSQSQRRGSHSLSSCTDGLHISSPGKARTIRLNTPGHIISKNSKSALSLHDNSDDEVSLDELVGSKKPSRSYHRACRQQSDDRRRKLEEDMLNLAVRRSIDEV